MSHGYGKGEGYARPGPPPLKRIRPEVIENPCSGRYEESGKGTEVELMVDIDDTTKFARALKFVSGTIRAENPTWSVTATSLHFRAIPQTVKISGGNSNNRGVTSDVRVVFSDGTKAGGKLAVKLAFSRIWKAELELEIHRQRKLSYKNLERKSKFFKEIKLDIDFTEKLIWPVVELNNVANAPCGMKDRKLDPFSAFEDAGLKLQFDEANSQKVDDPTPHSPWTKSDLYEVMQDYFNESDDSDDNIWCMMGTTPPDKRYMGFSFDKKGSRGFGLFTGHCSFKGWDSTNARSKAEAHRKLLHYLVHECGHCLGLMHPFEIGAPDSLSWMNYAWKYDAKAEREPGTFYKKFKFSFSDKELVILRHSPGKAFRAAASPAIFKAVLGAGYKARTEAPDEKLADDDDDYDVEAGGYGAVGSGQKPDKPRPMRKIGLDLKVQGQYSMSQLLNFEARIKNYGKLPALIEGDLSVESGNLQVYITKPDGSSQSMEPFVRPIYTGYQKPRVLYTSEDEEGPDRYSESVTIGAGSDGYIVDKPGKYVIRAVYRGGRYNVTSASYPITIEDDDDEDEETKEEVLMAATLEASNGERFKKTLNFWKKLESKNIEKKKSRVATLIALMEGLGKENGRSAGASGRSKRGGRRKVALGAAKPALSRRQLLKDTNDLVQYYHEKGTKEDNMSYIKLVMTRWKLFVAEKLTEDGDKEYNQLMIDVLDRGVKYTVIMGLEKKRRKMRNPPKVEEKYSAPSLQAKVSAVLNWAPTAYGNGEPDISGVGLGRPFSNFDIPQILKGRKIIQMLFTKYEETKDLRATIGYADKLQKGREVNNAVLQWAVEAFIVHSDDAKKAGIRYPEPDYKDKSFTTDAALVVTTREGVPTEQWMNYWRCDADFNYHHRHWHVVYVVGQFLRWLDEKREKMDFVGVDGHLLRQGELFGYMHAQLLARYDADRESWGLPPVQPWTHGETATPFSAGLEFHSHPQFRWYSPRPDTVWPDGAVELVMGWEAAYEEALESGIITSALAISDEEELTPNWSGHILEPSSRLYGETYGALHNTGHGVFGSTGIQNNASSYMSNTVTAVRDPIFFRWHKRIDNFFQKNNDFYRSEIGHDAPSVTITADDIILSTKPKPPAGFGKISYGTWVETPTEEQTCLKTYLGPATKRFEWDNKLDHEKFYYHLRMKRNADSDKNKDLALTIRIFICPKSKQTERRRWIEMDKFVCKIPKGEDHIQLTRADVHSSVIKRNPDDMRDDVEKKYTKEVGGFCECGWPYSMLLPRGKKDGEEYVLFVMATDNNIDSIGIRTHCGSMSYCGARGQEYPDTRNMGYPFSSPVTFKGDPMPIPGVFRLIKNAAYKTFTIENDVSEPPAMNAIDIWWPFQQLSVNDGTLRTEPDGGVTEYIKSELTGTFRVLVDNDATRAGRDSIMVRFQGRGPNGGSYAIHDVYLARRDGETMNIVSTESVGITYKGQGTFSVPEAGLISDAVEFLFNPAGGDYFLTFTLDSPGVYLPASQRVQQTSTYQMKPGIFPPPENWSPDLINARYAYIQCVSGIMSRL